MDINTKPMVRLTWLDAQESCTGWSTVEEMEESPLAECQEVGWLIVDNDEKVVIMRSWNDDGAHGGACIAIPQTWVLRTEVLVPVDDVKEMVLTDLEDCIETDWEIH